MRVAVTGGAGFIGRRVVDQLKAHGHHAIIIDRNREKGDVRRPSHCTLICDCDAVIHLAGVLGTSELFDIPREAIDANIIGTLNVLDACADGGTTYVGITMPDSRWPSIYQATKLAATRLASAYHHRYRYPPGTPPPLSPGTHSPTPAPPTTPTPSRIPTTHVRAFNAYGIGQAHGPTHPRKIIPTLATHSWLGEPMPIYGDGTQTVDLVHVNHIARCLTLAAISPELGHDETYDAGSGIELSVNEIASMIGDVTGCHDVEHLPMRDGETPHTSLCAKDPGPFGFDTLDPDRFALVVQWYKPR